MPLQNESSEPLAVKCTSVSYIVITILFSMLKLHHYSNITTVTVVLNSYWECKTITMPWNETLQTLSNVGKWNSALGNIFELVNSIEVKSSLSNTQANILTGSHTWRNLVCNTGVKMCVRISGVLFWLKHCDLQWPHTFATTVFSLVYI